MSMKATGIVRRIDDLGRVVIPKEIRRTLRIREGDPLEIFVDDDKIILRRYDPACTFTGSAVDLVDFKGRKVSKEAVYEMIKLAGITEIPS